MNALGTAFAFMAAMFPLFDSADISDVIRSRAAQVFAAIREELSRLGLDLEAPAWESSRLSVRQDPTDGCEAVFGIWEARDGQRQGSWMVRSDGQGIADIDVFARHPAFPRLLVESVSVFAEGPVVEGQARLCPL